MAHLDTHHQTTSGLQLSMQWHDRARGHGIVRKEVLPGQEWSLAGLQYPCKKARQCSEAY